jgi:hypothetical protein
MEVGHAQRAAVVDRSRHEPAANQRAGIVSEPVAPHVAGPETPPIVAEKSD